MTTPSLVLELKQVCKHFPGVKALQDVDLRLFAGEVHALLGENGAGKSTLFKMISGAEQADSGDISVGDTVQLASVDQFRDNLNPKNPVWQEISYGQEIAFTIQGSASELSA